MKFVSNKTVVDHAQRLYEIQVRKAKLRRAMARLVEEEESLEEFLEIKSGGEKFQFADDEGYLKETEFKQCKKTTVNLNKVRAFYARHGTKLPMKTSRWTEVSVHYVLEE
jgi:hypothetical protein